jgi:hypothetical protein
MQLISLAPGFSQVIFRMGTLLTWLKPGANEIYCSIRLLTQTVLTS